MYNKPYQGPNNAWGNQPPQGFSNGNTYGTGYQQPVQYGTNNTRPNQPAQWGNQQPNQWGGVYNGTQGNGQPYGQANQPFTQPGGMNQFYGNQMQGNQTQGMYGGQYGTGQYGNPYGNPYANQYGNNYRRSAPEWSQRQLSQYGKQNMMTSVHTQPPMPPQQQTQLRMLIDEMFMKYDFDRSGTLDCRELAPVFNEILMRFNIGVTLSPEEARALLFQIDVNTDGRINKTELFNCIKSLVINETTQPNRMY